MSQKVRIECVDVMGATPFLGLSDNDDPGSARLYSKDPDQVMTWLCDAWRTRFNQLRSRRKKYGPNKKLQPITDRVDERTHAQARHDCSWMAAVPSLLLNSPEKLEKQDWYAAVKRRKTLRGKHLDPGRMPRFKSRRKSDLTFACWYDDGRNARFVKYNRHHGAVIINGQNPTGYRHKDDMGVRFSIVIRVRLSQPIRDYSSVRATGHGVNSCSLTTRCPYAVRVPPRRWAWTVDAYTTWRILMATTMTCPKSSSSGSTGRYAADRRHRRAPSGCPRPHHGKRTG